MLGARLLVVAGSQSIAARSSLVQHFAEAGGDVLLVLTDASASAIEALAKKKDSETIKKLKQTLDNDPFYGVRIEAARISVVMLS